ncbi:MAG: hypothetical protein H7098_03965 [Oligoflexus sp.]|nr:hypothetical protein [Pseudopedobacter sp.]
MQDFLDFSRYKELTSKAEVSQDEIDDLANEINKSWWEENKENLKR